MKHLKYRDQNEKNLKYKDQKCIFACLFLFIFYLRLRPTPKLPAR